MEALSGVIVKMVLGIPELRGKAGRAEVAATFPVLTTNSQPQHISLASPQVGSRAGNGGRP